MVFYDLLIVLFSFICLPVLLAGLFNIAAEKPVRFSAGGFFCAYEITVAIYKYTILISLISASMLFSSLSPNVSAYRNISPEIIYFTSILIFILFQMNKRPEYPAANHS